MTRPVQTLSHPVRYILATHAVLVGAGYALGPPQWSSGSTFTVIRQLGIPVWVWGLVFLTAGCLLFVRRYTLGHGVAAVSFSFWGLCLFATVFTGEISGWGAPVHTLALAAPMHLLGLWRRSRHRARGVT